MRRPPGVKYSKALVAFGQDKVWDEATLTIFLRDPQGVVKGTKYWHSSASKRRGDQGRDRLFGNLRLGWRGTQIGSATIKLTHYRVSVPVPTLPSDADYQLAGGAAVRQPTGRIAIGEMETDPASVYSRPVERRGY